MSTENGAANDAVPPVDTPAGEEAPPTTALTLADLKPKMALKGTVKRIELFGAFVDVGVGRDGLVHISQLREEPVKNVNDVLTEGQEVTVWVRRVDQEQGRIDLTMIEPPGVAWNEIQVGQVLTGTVVRLERFGAFVELGAERPGMVHVSEMSNGYVGSPDEVVKVGDEVQVRVIKVNSRKKQIDLSMKALEAPVAEASAPAGSDDDDKVPTAMELALRRAMMSTSEEFPELERVIADAETDRAAGRKRGKQNKRDKQRQMDKRRQQQEEILSRTLSGRGTSRDRNAAPN